MIFRYFSIENPKQYNQQHVVMVCFLLAAFSSLVISPLASWHFTIFFVVRRDIIITPHFKLMNQPFLIHDTFSTLATGMK